MLADFFQHFGSRRNEFLRRLEVAAGLLKHQIAHGSASNDVQHNHLRRSIGVV